MLTDADLIAIGMIATETTIAEVVVHALVLDHQTADTTDHMATVVMMDTATTTVDATVAEEAEAAVREEARTPEMAHHH